MAVDIKRLICVRRYSENAMKNNSRIPGNRGKEQRYRFADARQAESPRNEPTAARRRARGTGRDGSLPSGPGGAIAARGGYFILGRVRFRLRKARVTVTSGRGPNGNSRPALRQFLFHL